METITHKIDPARLASGQWWHRSQRQIGEGDIHASYSADRIGLGQPVRKPFSWQGGLWVCTGIAGQSGESTAEAYRILPRSVFTDPVFSYAQKVCNGESARADPNGFYHGMSIICAGKPFVLSGKPVVFAPDKSCEQLSLF